MSCDISPNPLSSLCSPSQKGKGLGVRSAGFTLLEVMIAVGVLGIAMLALLSLHDSNLQSVIRGQELSSASILAQGLMSNAEIERVPMLGRTAGDFQRLFPGVYQNFRWERIVEPSGMFPDIRKVQVTIFYGPRFSHSLSLVEFLHDPTPQTPPGQSAVAGQVAQPGLPGQPSQPAQPGQPSQPGAQSGPAAGGGTTNPTTPGWGSGFQ
jgi:general secretion pathway protein I